MKRTLFFNLSRRYRHICLLLLAHFCFLTGSLAQTYPNICAASEPDPEVKRYNSCGSVSGDATFTAYNSQAHTWYDAVDDLTPVKTVHLAFVIWHRIDGTGGWPNTAASHNILREHIQFLSDKTYGENDPATYLPVAGTPFIPDTRIRFVVDTVYHMYNSTLYDTSLSPYNYNTPLYDIYPGARKTLNIHVIKGDTTQVYYKGAWGWASFPGNSISTDVGVVTKQPNPFTYMESAWAGHLAHELAHTLGLGHTYGSWNKEHTIFYPGDDCNLTDADFLSDVFGTTPDPYIFGMTPPTLCNTSCDVCPHAGGATNNIMGAGGGNFSPLQIGRMHRVLQGMSTRKYTWGKGNTPYTITASETWNFNIKVYQDIVIPSGKKLTIKCRVEMVPDAKITIEPGGTLVVDGGTITSALYAIAPWQGIEVVGNSLLPQKPVMGRYPQGRLILKNNAVIENARNAVTTWKYGDWNSTGGLIQATNATFRNNGRCVEFIAYGHPENSYFKNCTFIVNAPLLEGSSKAMVTAWEINGTRFQGNRFEFIPAGSPDAYVPPKGIFTISAGFQVTPSCNYPGPGFPTGSCFPDYAQPNTFKGLLYGIEALNSTAKTFKVDSAHFENCAIGIYTSAVNNFEVVRSTFDIKKYYGTTTQTGLSNDAGTGFKIQNNSFFSTESSPLSKKFFGLYSKNTGTALNEVYRNSYRNMHRANSSSMVNWASGASTIALGLKYKCNEQTSNRRDIEITDGTLGLIQGTFGSSGTPAGNTFSISSDTAAHIANFGSSWINYRYGTGAAEKPTQNRGPLVVVSMTTAKTCPSLLSWGVVILVADMKEIFKKSKGLYEDVQLEYEKLLVSDTPARDSMEALMARYAAEWNGAADELIRHYLTDSTEANLDSVLTWIGKKGDLAAQIMLADIEATNRNYSAAIKLIRMIKSAHPDLAREQAEELDSRMVYHELLNGFQSSGQEYWALNTEQQLSLYDFGTKGTTAAHSQAKNILAFFYGYIFDRQTPLVERVITSKFRAIARLSQDTENRLKVFPNPASGQVNLEWIPDQELHRVEIVNISGTEVYRQDNISSSKLSIDTRSLPAGIYTGSFSDANGNNREVFRLVIQR